MSEELFNVCFGEVRSMLAALEGEDYPDYTNLFALLSRIARRHPSPYREMLEPYLLGAGVPALLPPPVRRGDNTFDWGAWLAATGLAIASSPDGPLALDLSSVSLEDAMITSLRAEPWFTRLVWLDLRGSRLASSLILTMEDALSKEARVFPVSYNSKYHEGANFTQLFAPMRDFSWLDFEDASFEEASLEGASFSHCQLVRANFTGANLERVDFSNAFIKGADFGYANLEGANLRSTNLEDANLGHANLTGATVSLVRLEGTNLTGTNLTGVVFRRVRYNHDTEWPEGFDYHNMGLIGPGAELVDVSLTHALLEGVDLEHANLEGADLTNASLKNANLKSANLTRAKLKGANLEMARYNEDTRWPRGFNYRFKGMVGPRAHFSNLDLRHSRFADANLEGANFKGANLEWVNFEGANLEGANLEGTNLKGARLSGVAHDAKTRWPDGFDRARLAPRADDSSDG